MAFFSLSLSPSCFTWSTILHTQKTFTNKILVAPAEAAAATFAATFRLVGCCFLSFHRPILETYFSCFFFLHKIYFLNASLWNGEERCIVNVWCRGSLHFLEFWNFGISTFPASCARVGRTRRAGYQQYFWNEFLFFLNKRHAHHTRAHRRCGFVFFNSIETGRVCDKVEVGGQVVAWHLHSAP